MFELTIRSHFDSAHFLRNYQGKCARVHGHSWDIEVTVCGNRLDQAGMVVDFSVIKEKTNELVDQLDHQLLNDLPPFAEEAANPTAENIALYLFKNLQQNLQDYPVKMGWVRVWESPNAAVTYREDS